jgi:polysaccharide export outer membrane protein
MSPLIFVAVILMVLTSACSSTKNVTYFRDIPDSVKHKSIDQAAFSTPVIQIDDILQVNIQTLDPGSAGVLNQQNTNTYPTGTQGPGGSGTTANVSGYLVDKDGNVALPMIGKINVVGITTSQAREKIQIEVAKYFKDPVVNVRFANFKVTVLGEVVRPSTYVMPNEKVTLLDALGMAGDLTIYGKRENVLLIRDNNISGKKDFVRLDLTDSKFITSPYFYLHQGDVIYVEPNKSKVAATDMTTVKRLTILTSVLTLLIVIASRINY